MTTNRAHNNHHRWTRYVYRHRVYNKLDVYCEASPGTATGNLLDTQWRGLLNAIFGYFFATVNVTGEIPSSLFVL